MRLTLMPALTLLLLPALNGSAHAQQKVSGPIVCAGDDAKTLRNLTIDTAGDAVKASDNCVLVLENCVLQAGKAGVRASENAEVKLSNCVVSGQGAAVVAEGNATVTAARGVFRGKIATSENGEFKPTQCKLERYSAPKAVPPTAVPSPRTGGADKAVPPPAAPTPRTGGGAKATLKDISPVSCVGLGQRTLKNVRIQSRGPAVSVTGGCGFTFVDSELISSGTAVVLNGTGTVKLTGTHVKGAKAADLRGTGALHAKGCLVEGAIVKQGNARFVDEGGNTLRK